MTYRLRVLAMLLVIAAVFLIAGTVTAFAGGMLGDANSDGNVTILDATCIQRQRAGLRIGEGFSESAADVDGNGVIEITDATLIQRWTAHIETPYPIGVQPTQRPTDDDGWGHVIYRP